MDSSCDDIQRIALLLYYNSSSHLEEFGAMSEALLNNIQIQHCNGTMERGIVAALGFFSDKGMRIVCNENALNDNPIAEGIPAGWRNSIVVIPNVESQVATYYMRCLSIRFKVSFLYDGDSVTINVYYAPKQAGYPLAISKERLNGLVDGNQHHRLLYANNIIDMMSKKYSTSVIKRALKDEPPSCAPTPAL